VLVPVRVGILSRACMGECKTAYVCTCVSACACVGASVCVLARVCACERVLADAPACLRVWVRGIGVMKIHLWVIRRLRTVLCMCAHLYVGACDC
jgi:hypothetical protein